MDVSRLSSLNHTYEDIEGQPLSRVSPLGQPSCISKKSNSDTDLLKLCGQELEIINNLVKGYKNHQLQTSTDVTFSLYGQIEEGFYKCHDSIYDVPETQRIPDLMKKRPNKASVTKLEMKQNDMTKSKRRLSLDSGHGTSVADSETDLDSSLSSSMPSLYSQDSACLAVKTKRPKANDQMNNYEELSMSDALDRICGTSSLESLPGEKIRSSQTFFEKAKLGWWL